MSEGAIQGDVDLVEVPWQDADATRLRAEQQAEVEARYAHLDEADDFDVPDLDPADVRVMLVVRLDGVPVACGALRRSVVHGADVAELKRIYVVPALRRRGLSRRVLGHLETRAAELGYRRLVLETGTEQPESLGLYRAAGYVDTEPFGPYLGSPSLICLAKDL